MRRTLWFSAGALFLAAGLLTSRWGWAALQVVGRLLFGWWSYAARVLPRVTVAWDGVATALVCLVLFTVGLHCFLRWLAREGGGRIAVSDPERHRWPARRTVALVTVVVAMFVAGIAATGIVHQVGWLISAKGPRAVIRSGLRDDRLPRNSALALQTIGFATYQYASSIDRLPATKYDTQGRALHSWQSVLLPYVWTSARTSSYIDYDHPWDSPRNSAYFRGIVPDYLNSEIVTIRNPQGYALSHYAGNRHILGSRKPLRLGDLANGAANTILAGEVADGFKPWGDPTNLRDPVREPKGTPQSFGNLSRTGANFLFGDGSVRFLGETTSPEILRRLSVSHRQSSRILRPDPSDPDGSVSTR